VTWYPSGSGSGPSQPGQTRTTSTGTVISEAPEADPPTEQNPSDDELTLTQQTRVHRRPSDDDDAPTIARDVALVRQPNEQTVSDDDPTVNRPALSRVQPAAELLDQRYQLLGQIGVGGMGEVWRARHVQLARDVAIKFLTNQDGGPRFNPTSAASRPARDAGGPAGRSDVDLRFKLEAQAIAVIRHTGVVDVLDFGETAQGVPYFVMELLEGETLSARVRRTGPLAWAQVRHIALEITDALAHAHAAGVIHRDLKPSNVIVLESPPPRGSSTKLIDFGIAKLMDEGKPKITKTGFIQGTPAYMSPEQVLAEPVDARADVYGLGCLLYYLLSGQRPFADKTGTAALRAQVYEQPARFADVVPGLQVHADIESVVFRAMAKDKTARFESMQELHRAILAIPPDAGASLPGGAPPPSRLQPKSSDPLRTTASYSSSYDALDVSDTLVSSSSGSSSGHGLSGAHGALGSGPSRSVSIPVDRTPAGQEPRDERAKLIAAVAGSGLLVAAAIAALIWALTS
jgi:serine/threonine-protein kinase